MARDKKRKADVFYYDCFAGILEETEKGYRFVYSSNYLKTGKPVSLSLPLQKGPLESDTLFPFFAGMNSEGWYRDIVCATKKIDPTDEFGILLVTGDNTIGAVTVRESGVK
ncbi:HipA domain-containing protein [Candidatus Omnitrophus magneticus]|uniref:HipA domain-containing protein n=1 Tax=Candidatus Omnitrophus magneticus TaxID=1609969 RepID=A0A0F0CR99_9BACT|nr:HipA domain-containing protein [Candidatus Omnitrophus magneticus]